MPAPNNPATARIALTVDRDTRKFVNTFHMTRADGAVLTLADLQNMTATIADWWLNSYRHANNVQVVGDNVVATKQDPSNPLQDTVYLAAPGDYPSGAAFPGDVTSAVSWRSGLAGRKYRGRFYDFAVPNNVVNTNDTMVGSYITLLTSVGAYLLSHAVTNGLKVIVFHRDTNTFTPLVGVIVDQLVDSMRRRLAGRGI